VTQGEKRKARAEQIPLNDLIPKGDVKAGFRMVFGASHSKSQTTTEETASMKKTDSTKQSKKDKPGVELKDLKPTKDAKGQLRPRGMRDPAQREPSPTRSMLH
jgi:hypothetical protein